MTLRFENRAHAISRTFFDNGKPLMILVHKSEWLVDSTLASDRLPWQRTFQLCPHSGAPPLLADMLSYT